VLLNLKDYQTTKQAFWPWYKGPFEMIEKLSLVTFWLRMPPCVRLANSKARIKPTAPLLAFDKENSIEFPLDLVYYIYMQSNPNPVFLSHTSLWVNLLSRVHQYYKLKEKKKKKKRNNDLADLPSHDTLLLSTIPSLSYKQVNSVLQIHHPWPKSYTLTTNLDTGPVTICDTAWYHRPHPNAYLSNQP